MPIIAPKIATKLSARPSEHADLRVLLILLTASATASAARIQRQFEIARANFLRVLLTRRNDRIAVSGNKQFHVHCNFKYRRNATIDRENVVRDAVNNLRLTEQSFRADCRNSRFYAIWNYGRLGQIHHRAA